MYGLYGRCHELHLHDPKTKCMLFDALVRPILNYCCEIWALLGSNAAFDMMEKVHTSFLRQLLGVPTNTSSKMLYAEFGRLPLRCMWMKQCLFYLQRLSKLHSDCMITAALDADVQKGLGWYHGLSQQLRQRYDLRLPRIDRECNFASIANLVQDREIAQIMTAEDGNHLQQTYYSFKTEYRMEPYITQSKNRHMRGVVARFRLGSHWLQVCKGRNFGQPFQNRTCRCCRRDIETEEHAIFACRENTHLRESFADLFQGEPGTSLRSFLVHNPCHRLALFLTACKAVKAQPARTFIEVDCDLDLELGMIENDAYSSSDDT